MSIGIIIFILFVTFGFAIGNDRMDVVFTVGGYALAALCITIVIVFGCIAAYTYFIHYLWTTGMAM